MVDLCRSSFPEFSVSCTAIDYWSRTILSIHTKTSFSKTCTKYKPVGRCANESVCFSWPSGIFSETSIWPFTFTIFTIPLSIGDGLIFTVISPVVGLGNIFTCVATTASGSEGVETTWHTPIMRRHCQTVCVSLLIQPLQLDSKMKMPDEFGLYVWLVSF